MTELHSNLHGGDSGAVAARLGLTGPVSVTCDFSVNINPMGPPPCVARVMAAAWDRVGSYPDVKAAGAEAALARAHGVDSAEVVVGNGSTEILGWILQGLQVKEPAQIVPCYGGYAEACEVSGLSICSLPVASAKDGFRINWDSVSAATWDLLFVGSPNNPTGVMTDRSELLELARMHPDRWIVVDESFMDFVVDSDQHTLMGPGLAANLIVLKSLTKFFAIPGLRLGMACGSPEPLARLRSVRLPWTVNALAQAVAKVLYQDRNYLEQTRRRVHELRAELLAGLNRLSGFEALDASANFVLVRLPETETGSGLQKRLLEDGCLIRSCTSFESLGERYCRLAVRPHEEIGWLIDAIESPGIKHPAPEQRPPALMVVGTMSDSGKSIVAAALCRHIARQGRSVAPFKAQNMSLNSFVTREGGEMGRAQVVQAQAAGIEPHTDMNPVLLKPMRNAGSQVIVNGESIGNFSATEYYEMKARMAEAAHDAYDRLVKAYDVIVLEGAGSPAEINLQAEDIVNMSMAEYAGAAVILVADIDRGGVFASIFGTLALMPDAHRRLIKGVIINKFRGDESLLDPGIRQIEDLTGIPVLGVLPYIQNLRIEDEDSVALDRRVAPENGVLDIVVVRLPRISNFTDFLALERTAGVSVRYLSAPGDLGEPDLVIIPGTKHTCADLEFLQEAGWAEVLPGVVANGTPVFGICGGYQMLGSRVVDPTGAEGGVGEAIGLNLLPVSTVLEPQKELAQVRGVTQAALPFACSGTTFSGYEIHAGRTTATGEVAQPLCVTRRRDQEVSEPAGAVSDDGMVFGCYLHGLFDEPDLRKQLLDWLCTRKDMLPPEWHEISGVQDEELDRLTDVLVEHVDMGKIEGMVGRESM